MKRKKIIPYLILLLTIPSIVQWLNFDTQKTTAFWWLIDFLIIVLLIESKSKFNRINDNPIFVQFFLLCVIVESAYGIFRSQGYWDYKALIANTFTFLLPIGIFVFSNPKVLSRTIYIWLKYCLVLFWIILPIMQPECVGKFLVPLLFLLLFIKPIPIKYKIIIAIYFSLIFILGSLGARSTVIKFTVALMFGLSMYILNYKSLVLIRLLQLVLLLFPLILFVFAVFGNFNVFKMDDYLVKDKVMVKDSYNSKEQESISSDTRTFIYREAIVSAFKNNYVLFGNSLARGYDSDAFADTDKYRRGERYDSEVSIINVFTHFGIIGVVVYWLIFISSTYYAIYKSNSSYMKMLGLYVSFRWVFAWIEDFSRFDLNYLFIWIFIAMCYSDTFRLMNDFEFELWVKSIFGKRAVMSEDLIKSQNSRI
jgi:hypothetical protein